jgi:hypothetical protein
MTRVQARFAHAAIFTWNSFGRGFTGLLHMVILLPAVIGDAASRNLVKLDRWIVAQSPKSEPKKEVEPWTANAQS